MEEERRQVTYLHTVGTSEELSNKEERDNVSIIRLWVSELYSADCFVLGSSLFQCKF